MANGGGTVGEGDVYCFKIKEEKEYKYLGIWFSGVKAMFKTRGECNTTKLGE